jgi:restriction system protein
MGRHHGLHPIQDGYIAIGWHEVGDLNSIAPDRPSFKERVTHIFPQDPPGKIPVVAGVLYRFAHEMRPGDIVVFPSKPDRMVNIGRIASEYEYRRDGSEYPNLRRVTWLRSIPRASFSQSALHEIGSALTLFKVTNHGDEFIAALEGREIDPHDVDATDVEIVSAEAEESTEDFIIKRLKSSQSAYQFEHFVAHLLKCMGYFARVTQASGDGGVDIIAHRDELGFDPPIIKVQCKQVLGTIGRPDVQQLHGAIEPGEHGLFVTLGKFSADARTFERTKPNLRLIDGDALIELIYSHYAKFEPRYQMLLPLKRVYIPGLMPAEGEAA